VSIAGQNEGVGNTFKCVKTLKKRKVVLWWTEVMSRSCWQRFEVCREITMLNEKKMPPNVKESVSSIK
jgi:hypothetical protein